MCSVNSMIINIAQNPRRCLENYCPRLKAATVNFVRIPRVSIHVSLHNDKDAPACLKRRGDPEFALLVHPSILHVPQAPCLAQAPRACARVVQPSVSHTFLVPPPCFQHRISGYDGSGAIVERAGPIAI